eukprot:TRINITY_DN15940_c0_g1_i1.p1 TRINITY_DN15940_c0_g1~~TRINITY_DN15940_c0_g1_i1.p1  ORF type:complete len:671 (+),score=101.61 TRINITY_DN15940_c0_g1_i1:131-2143(+)
MTAVVVRTIDGITYPREVPCPDGFPPGWKATEKAHGEGSKASGKTYVRYDSNDGRHKGVASAKSVFKLHCEDNGLDFTTEFAKYERKAEEKAEARGLVKPGPTRDQYIAASRKHFGELNGEIVFALPGWKCRWDLIESGQTPKTFTDPDGLKFILVVNVECKFGAIITRAGGIVPNELAAAVEAAKKNFAAHELFRTGTSRCRESKGSVELSADSSDIKVETKEQRAERMLQQSRVKKKQPGLKLAGQADYKDWKVKVATLSEADVTTIDGAGAIFHLLKARGFKIADLMLHVGATKQKNKYADTLQGLYFRKGKDDSDRPVYQGVKVSCASPRTLVGLDKYIYWSDAKCRWEMGDMCEGRGAVAFSKLATTSAVSADGWMILRSDFGSAEHTSSAQAVPEKAPSVASTVPVMQEQPPPIVDAQAKKDKKDNKDKTDKKDKKETNRKTDTEGTNAKKRKDTSVDESICSNDTAPVATKVAKTEAGDKPAGSQAKTKNAAQPATEDDGFWHTEKIWKYEECTQGKRRGEDLTSLPAHWPPDVVVCPGRWVEWLPPDWYQGRKMGQNGQFYSVYISPTGATTKDRKIVEKMIGRELLRLSDKSSKSPEWPPWLPPDWGLSYKVPASSGIVNRIFVQPDGKRFLWDRASVERCVANGLVNQTGTALNIKESES